MNKFWTTVWQFCDFYSIPLGRFTPYVIGKSIGNMGVRVGSTKWLVTRMYHFLLNFEEGGGDFHLSQEEVDELIVAAEKYLGVEGDEDVDKTETLMEDEDE